MRIAIVSDVHANLSAFLAVLDHAGQGGPVDAVWCPGDIVGYGPQPNECIELLREFDHVAVAGNHDLAACGKMGVVEFNDAAAAAARWTATQLTPRSRTYLEELPFVVQEGDFTLVHGSLRDPEWEYLLSPTQAQVQFALQETPYSIVGHSHLAFVCREDAATPPALDKMNDGDCVQLDDRRLILNPGGAGQPRDGDPRAGYTLYDDEARSVTFARVEYDIETTQTAMRKAALPRWLIERLSDGL